MSSPLERLGLHFNPFEPSASGAPVTPELWLPNSWGGKLREMLDMLGTGRGVKAVAIAGEYGGGKTYILQWLFRHEFPSRRIKPFYFDNPGIQFYDLANSLLRQIGRKDFAKFLWELSDFHVGGFQRSLFVKGFEEYLQGQRAGRARPEVLPALQAAILRAGVTKDDEIAHRLARIIAETPVKPFFEYRDFIAGGRNTLVAEREEAPYFSAILKTLQLGAGIKAVAFLIDEFEEVALQKRLTRREAHDYLATLKRLINLTTNQELWLVVGMTPAAVEITRQLEPALWERFTGEGRYSLQIPPLTALDAIEIVRRRLEAARPEGSDLPSRLYPFPEGFESVLSPAVISSPRRLIKVCFYAISEADSTTLPFSKDYLISIESKAYPAPEQEEQ